MHKEQEQKQYDPRFYLIKIIKIRNAGIESKMIKNKNNLQLKFELGNKNTYSTLQFSKELQDFNPQNKSVYEDLHIMKYGGQEYINIFLDQIDKHNNKIQDGMNCYARILLAPLIQLPHSRHRINVMLCNNIIKFDSNSRQIKQMLQVTLDIYYQLNFHGRIELIPTIANLQRNIAQIGEMKPIIYLKYENKEWRSLQAQAGIHPCWSGHFYAKRNKQKIIENLQNIQQNIKTNKSSELVNLRRARLLHNSIYFNKQQHINQADQHFINKNGPYFDIISFDMACAGSSLNVQILSLPFLGSKQELIGSANIRISNSGFLKHPRLQQQNIYEQKTVNLYFQQEGATVKIGTVKFYVRFVFDINKIINKQPSIFQIQ